MARTRLLSPKFFLDDDLAERSAYARLTFAGLILIADREGRLDDRPKVISAELFPFEVVDMDALLDELAATRDGSGGGGFIVRYQSGGRRYLAVRNFLKYQTPHFREAQSLIPAPPGEAEPAADPEAEPKAEPKAEQPCMDPVTVPVPVPVSDPVSVTRKPAAEPAAEPAHAGEIDPRVFTQQLVAEVARHLPDSGVKAHPGLTTAIANLLDVGHPGGPIAASNARTGPLAREDLVDAVHGWILAEQRDPWHAKQRAEGDPFTLSRLLTNAFLRLPDYAEKGRAGWGKSGGLEHQRTPPIEAPVDPEITVRHHARDAVRLAKVTAWRAEKPPEDIPAREKRKWWEEHKARRP